MTVAIIKIIDCQRHWIASRAAEAFVAHTAFGGLEKVPEKLSFRQRNSHSVSLNLQSFSLSMFPPSEDPTNWSLSSRTHDRLVLPRIARAVPPQTSLCGHRKFIDMHQSDLSAMAMPRQYRIIGGMSAAHDGRQRASAVVTWSTSPVTNAKTIFGRGKINVHALVAHRTRTE